MPRATNLLRAADVAAVPRERVGSFGALVSFGVLEAS